MAKNQAGKRINNVAREFSVSQARIVDFLEKQGVKVEDGNQKLTPCFC